MTAFGSSKPRLAAENVNSICITCQAAASSDDRLQLVSEARAMEPLPATGSRSSLRLTERSLRPRFWLPLCRSHPSNAPHGKVAAFPFLRLHPTVSGKSIREQISGKLTWQVRIGPILGRDSRHRFPIGKPTRRQQPLVRLPLPSADPQPRPSSVLASALRRLRHTPRSWPQSRSSW